MLTMSAAAPVVFFSLLLFVEAMLGMGGMISHIDVKVVNSPTLSCDTDADFVLGRI